MILRSRFFHLAQNKFPYFYRKWSRERDVSARAIHLKAAHWKVQRATNERNEMSTSTTFKRIALVAVASLGLGVLSSGPSMSVVSAETLTATPSATSVAVGDSLTITIVNEFTSSTSDTSVIGYNITAPAGGSNPVALYSIAVADTVNATSSVSTAVGLPTSQVKYAAAASIASVDTLTAGTGVAKYNKATATLTLQSIPSVGTYYVSVYTTGAKIGRAHV